jgi:predicted nucleic acid-binding protein
VIDVERRFLRFPCVGNQTVGKAEIFGVAYKRKIDFLVNENVSEIVWIDKSFAEKAWKIFERFNADKRWSFTDCTSYIVMKETGITEVFSFDHHFGQTGFIRKP